MPLAPSYGPEGDTLITTKLEEMYDFASAGHQGSTLSAAQMTDLCNVLVKRLHESPAPHCVEIVGETISEQKAAWVEHACHQINISSYNPDRDPAQKIVDALRVTAMTKEEYDIYKKDFDTFDTDSDGLLDEAEVKALLTKQLEREPTQAEVSSFIHGFDRNNDNKVSFDEYLTRICGKYELTGLTDEDAMQGFLEDLSKVPVSTARAGLASGEFKERADELAKLSDAEVMEEYKKQSLEVWATMADDESQQGQMLADVMEKLDQMGSSPQAAQLKEMLKDCT